jgi:hypothetical protein
MQGGGSAMRMSIVSASPSNTNQNALKETYQDAIKRVAKKPLKGQMSAQLALHYLSFIVFALVAMATWSSGVSASRLIFFCTLCFITMEISRVLYIIRPDTMVPMYLTLLPFIAITNVVRGEPLFVVIWFAETLLLFLQSGNIHIKAHLICYAVIFMTVSVVRIAAQNALRCNINDFANLPACLVIGMQLDEPTFPQSAGTVMAVASIIVLYCAIIMENFIKRHALALLDHENRLHALHTTNMDLNRAIRRFNRKKERNMNAPISTVVDGLSRIRTSGQLSMTNATLIDKVLADLNSKNLFAVTLAAGVDSEVQGFLEDVLQAAKKAETTVPILTVISESEEELVTAEEQNNRVSLNSNANDAMQNTSMDRMLENLQSFQFDVMEFNRLFGQPIVHIGLHCLRQHRLFERLPIDQERVTSFFAKIDSGYIATNPYHNAVHGADVTASMNRFISQGMFTTTGAASLLTAEELLACIIGAAIHDFRHPGMHIMLL